MLQAIIKMLRVTIAVAMILAIVLLVVKTSVVRLPALQGLRKLKHELLAATSDDLMAILAG